MKHFFIFGSLVLILIIVAIVFNTRQQAITPELQDVTVSRESAQTSELPTANSEVAEPEAEAAETLNDIADAEVEVNIVTPTPPNNETPRFTSAVIKTSLGDVTVSFFGDDSPMTVNNFINLAEMDFYDGILFHRVIPDFMVQTGDPLSRNPEKALHGTGGPGYTFADEFNDHQLVKGSLAMANSGPDTNGSQFFIVTAAATPWLDGKHTNFGQVTAGLDVVELIQGVERDQRDNPLQSVSIIGVDLIE